MSLAVKTILGFLNLLLWMGAALFWPAGTFRYPEAWIYLLIFFSGIAIITLYIFRNDKDLLQSRLKVGAVAEKRIAQKIIQGIAGPVFIGMYVVSGFDQRFGWSGMPLWVEAAGQLLVALSLVLFFIVFAKNTFLSATVEIRKDHKLISDGPYAVVRHPMYSAALLLFIGTPAALGSWWSLAAAPFMILVLVMRCLDEEKMLHKELEGYTEYRNKVRYRLVPGIW